MSGVPDKHISKFNTKRNNLPVEKGIKYVTGGRIYIPWLANERWYEPKCRSHVRFPINHTKSLKIVINVKFVNFMHYRLVISTVNKFYSQFRYS